MVNTRDLKSLAARLTGSSPVSGTILIAGLLLCASARGAVAYPFSIANRETPDGLQLIASNLGPAPVSVRVTLATSTNLASDRTFPLYAVIPADTRETVIAAFRPANPGQRYGMRAENTWLPGDYTAHHDPGAVYRLPYRDGERYRIGQAPGGPITTHVTPDSRFAVDIAMPEGTTVVAARDGRVIEARGDNRRSGETADLLDQANLVRIVHADGSIAAYAHLQYNGVLVSAGQDVRAGDAIGLAGSTGFSSGPHLHFAIQTTEATGKTFQTVSVPFRFMVGSPSLLFSPTTGMRPLAEYRHPGQIPVIER